MVEIASFRAVIELWPSREAMASDVGGDCKASAVSKWWQRDSIPAEWWSAVLSTGRARDAGINAERLAVLAARDFAEARP